LIKEARTSEHGYDKESRKKSNTLEMNWIKRVATIEQGCEVTLSSTLKRQEIENSGNYRRKGPMQPNNIGEG
jgi:hypothetical protein